MQDNQHPRPSPKARTLQNNGSQLASSRRTRSNWDLASISVIIQKCVQILKMFPEHPHNYKPHKQHLYHHNNDPQSLLITVSGLIDQIYEKLSLQHLQPSGKKQGEPQSPSSTSTTFNQIEHLLQKQEQLNRNLIKKQLQIREEYKSLLEEFNQDKKNMSKLSQHVNKLKDDIREKDLAILHLQNQLKASQKEKLFYDCEEGKYNANQLFQRKMERKSRNGDENGRIYGRECDLMNGVNRLLGHRRRNSQDVYRRGSGKIERKKSTLAKK